MATIKDLLSKMIDKIKTIPTKVSDLEMDVELGKVKTVNGIEPDEEGNVDLNFSTDTDTVALLVSVDMLPAIHDADGKILTNETGKIILRY